MTDSRRLRMSKLTLGSAVALAAAPAFAQSTSSGGGLVTSGSGQPVAGAEVTITHVESGTVSRATTDATGRWNSRGLRVGGPYTITITKPGEGTKTEDNVYLALNQVSTVNAELAGDVTTLGAVQVTGVSGGSVVFSATNMGAGTSVDRQVIDALPSMNGNIQDFMRLDPARDLHHRVFGGAMQIRRRSSHRTRASTRSPSMASRPATPSAWKATTCRPCCQLVADAEAIEAIDINLSNYDVGLSGRCRRQCQRGDPGSQAPTSSTVRCTAATAMATGSATTRHAWPAATPTLPGFRSMNTARSLSGHIAAARWSRTRCSSLPTTRR